MKKTILKIEVFGILTVVLMGLFMPIHQTYALEQMEDYTVLAPLPGTTKGGCNNPGDAGCKTDLKTYLEGFFKLAIGLSAVAAVLMIVIGGFQYISTDAIMKKEEGRNRIQNAVYGLVLVIGAWLILATINPNLLRINLDIKPASTSAPAFTPGGAIESVTPGVVMTPEQITLSNARRASLQAEGIDTYRGPCTQGQATGCVNLNGLTDTTKDGLVLTKLALTNSGCTTCKMIITAGTEISVHAVAGDHPAGRAVDLKPDPAFSAALGFPNPKDGDTKTKIYKVDGKPDITATFTYETLGGNAGGTSTGNHWHVVFK